MNRLLSIAITLAGLTTVLPAAAQFQKPEDAVRYRQGVMRVMGEHFGRIGAMVNGRVPYDPAAVQANAAITTMLSKLPFAAFGPGTDTGDTRAKPDIWTETAKFKAAASKMQDEMAKLNAAAQGGNQDQVKTAFGATGAACKACHDDFRKK